LDPAIKQLLDQQAEIQARLAQLLPQKYGPNIRVELEMLRQKLRALEAYATDNREPFSSLLLLVHSLRLLDNVLLLLLFALYLLCAPQYPVSFR
jgi:hypothetical protein